MTDRPIWIPKDAREVYLDEKGKPVAFCPRDNLGLTDIQRGAFYHLNLEVIPRLSARVRAKNQEDLENGPFCVVCINVDDPTWTWLVDQLMPGHEALWADYRAKGMVPIARGVVPLELMQKVVDEVYPAAGQIAPGYVNVFVCDAGGIAVIATDPLEREST